MTDDANVKMQLPDLFDYIIVGGGLAGSVISNRLFQWNNSLSILVVEAGVDASNNTVIPYANNTNALIGSDLDWGYFTEPQSNLNGRKIDNPAGKCLGGGTAINSCGWIRGDQSDYDLWAELVGDDRFSYERMLPYFVKTEQYWDPNITPHEHGANGPVHVASVSSTGRHYPLRNKVAQAWKETGVEALPKYDGNAGRTLGIGELNENRRNGLRQLASSVYPQSGVHVLTKTLVKRVLLSTDANGGVKATGIETASGIRYSGKEVIVSAGSYRTPQLLMLSGIGPKDTLSKFGIKPVVASEQVGRNLHDHLQFSQFWKLKDPSAGYALGSNNTIFTKPEFSTGMPTDWVVNTAVGREGLTKAITADEGKAPDPKTHPLLKNPRSFLETLVLYMGGNPADPKVPLDGSHITSTFVHLLPTSNGTVTINSTNPADPPVINPNYFATETDRYVLRSGVRSIANVMLNTPTGKSLIDSETPPDGFKPVSLNATDDYLDSRIQHSIISTYHPVSTCSMGKVIDTNFRVNGVSNLRVVDASVIPTPIAAHIQAAVYALAERAAAIISEKP